MLMNETPALLVSLPNLNDPYFQQAVILLVEFHGESAFGVMINRSSPVHLQDLIADEDQVLQLPENPLLMGGPVQPNFVWCVHTSDFLGDNVTQLTKRLCLSPIQDVLPSLSSGQGPAKFHIGFGYSGWGPDQLNQEIREGAWWLAPLDDQLVLDMPYEDRWKTVIDRLGINPQSTHFGTVGEA